MFVVFTLPLVPCGLVGSLPKPKKYFFVYLALVDKWTATPIQDRTLTDFIYYLIIKSVV